MLQLLFTIILVNLFFVTISLQAYQKKGQSPLWNATNADLLKQDLLYQYDKHAFPIPYSYSDSNFTVDITLDIKHIHVDEIGHALTIQGILKMEWEDYRLTWDPDDYGGIETTYIGKHEIWIPDIFLYASKTIKDLDHFGNVLCVVNASGNVIWQPPTQFVPFCWISNTYWPFDKQFCTFDLVSYIYDGYEMRLTSFEGYEKSTEHYGMNAMSVWEILSVKEYSKKFFYGKNPEPFYGIYYKINVRRVSSSNIFVVVLPAIVTTFLIISLFWLPLEGSKRFVLSSISLVIICINILYISKCLPIMSSPIPRIVVFYAIDLLMVVFALVVSRFFHWVSTIETPLPSMYERIIQGPAGKFLGVQPLEIGGLLKSDLEQRLIDISLNQSVQWLHVAMALNRFVSILYILIFFCLGTWIIAEILMFKAL